MSNARALPALKPIGRGRSAVVYRDDQFHPARARKVFVGEGMSHAVLVALTGAGNPYRWCRAAIDGAVHRRRILRHLVQFWFDGRVRLPQLYGAGWDPHHRAFALEMELIDGIHAPLRLTPGDPDRAHELDTEVMVPLQDHLRRSGFDGLLWQTGYGNPVAAGNFMLEPMADGHRWVWVDLESGVPALFALNPWATIRHYLPASFRHRRPLFDDVDVARLRRYVEVQSGALDASLGPDAVGELHREIEALDDAQRRAKAFSRSQRAVAEAAARGRITQEQARYYATRPLRFAARRVGLLAGSLARLAGRALRRLRRTFAPRNVGQWIRRGAQFATDGRYRKAIAHHRVFTALQRWHRRGHLDRDRLHRLRRALRRGEDAAYVTDFAVHLGLKPALKLLQWVALPILAYLGIVPMAVAVVAFALGGPLARTFYTVMRSLDAVRRGAPIPWVALGVGLLPSVGNAAYPAQILVGSTRHDAALGRFLVCDVMTSIGRAIPIWGAADSQIEHALGRVALAMTKPRLRRDPQAASRPVEV